MCTHDDAWGAYSRVGAGAVALMEVLSGYSALPEGASLSSYRYGDKVRVWGHTGALGAHRQVVAKAGNYSSEVALHSLRIGAAAILAAEGEVPLRVIFL